MGLKKTFPPAPVHTKSGTLLTETAHRQSAPPEPPEVDWSDDLWTLEQRCRQRLVQGEAEYGNNNLLHKTPGALLVDAQEELEDARNYLFMLWRRLELMREQCDAEMASIERKAEMYRGFEKRQDGE
jgi:hypothetical protein